MPEELYTSRDFCELAEKFEELKRENEELVSDKTYLINAAMDGGDKYHYTAHDIAYRDLERKCKALEAENAAMKKDLKARIAELTECIGSHMADVYTLKARIAELREDNATLGDSNAWIKQNYEDLERDYGVMHEKMCARIDKLTAENKVLEAACEILRKQNKRLFSQVFSDGKPELNVCEACGGDGTVLLRDGYEGQVIATAKCIYCNGTGRVNKECEE